jgi:tRNA-dihydrouridine synthase 1
MSPPRAPFISNIAAPMVNQSDAPFRHLVVQHGASCAYTQMLLAHTFLEDRAFRDFHLKDIQIGPRPCVVQLGGNDVDEVVRVVKEVAPFCDGIGELCHAPATR